CALPIFQAHTEVCSCGRNTMRLGPVVGRKKQMIKYKGTTLYPPAMDNILNDFSEVECYIIEISNNNIGTDEICIKIATKTPSDKLLSRIKDHFRADRKSTRLNSSHVKISYAVFCLKK